MRFKQGHGPANVFLIAFSADLFALGTVVNWGLRGEAKDLPHLVGCCERDPFAQKVSGRSDEQGVGVARHDGRPQGTPTRIRRTNPAARSGRLGKGRPDWPYARNLHPWRSSATSAG